MNCSKMFLSMVINDLRTGFRRIWPAGAVFVVLYAVYWAVMSGIGGESAPEDRIAVLYFSSMFFSFYVPAAVYGHINDPVDGLAYIMLPVPAMTKFAVMMTVSVLAFPLGFCILIYAVDIVAALAGGGRGFCGMVWEGAGGQSVSGFLSDFVRICLYQSVFVLGNIVIKKHKTALAFLAMLVFSGAAAWISEIAGDGSRLLKAAYAYLLPLLLWYLSYRMFRRIQLK